jgi:plasmid stabilization system protein ParE
MKYDVVMTNEAQQNARAAFRWYAERSPEAAEHWCDGLLDALASLETDPQRCPLANENSRFPIELKQLLYGSGHRISHRIIFAIRPSVVAIHAIRHVTQGEWRPEVGEA